MILCIYNRRIVCAMSQSYNQHYEQMSNITYTDNNVILALTIFLLKGLFCLNMKKISSDNIVNFMKVWISFKRLYRHVCQYSVLYDFYTGKELETTCIHSNNVLFVRWDDKNERKILKNDPSHVEGFPNRTFHI